MAKTYGVGVIGAGVIFDDHARSYGLLGNRARLVGLADVDVHKRSAAANRYFIPVLTGDYKDLLGRDDIDVIDVCTPPFLHEQMVVDALEAGKHVICEKPLAHTLASADRIIDASKSSKGQVSVMYQLRYLPAIQRAIFLRDQGLLGPLLFGRFGRTFRLSGSDNVASGWWGRWQVAGGGALMTQFIHELDLMLHLFGPATKVWAVADTLKQSIESEDTITMTVRFENGALVEGCCTVAAHRWGLTYDILGRDASVHLPWRVEASHRGLRWRASKLATRMVADPTKSRMPAPLRRVRALAGRFLPLLRPPKRPPDHLPMIRAFLDVLDQGGSVPVDLQQARASLELCVAVYTAALTGQPVSLPLGRNCPYYEGVTADEYRARLGGASKTG